jgi:hypothetical protein
MRQARVAAKGLERQAAITPELANASAERGGRVGQAVVTFA